MNELSPDGKARSPGLEHHHLPEACVLVVNQGSHQDKLPHHKGSMSPADPAYSKLEAHVESVSEGVTQCAHSLTPPSPLRNQKPLQAFKQRDLNDGLNYFL